MAKAIIFAGGSGVRMNSKSKPKQFLTLYGKPVIIYTIEHFENHSDIDGIVVVCIKEWIGKLTNDLKKYGIEKVKWIVEGGSTAFESIYRGLYALKDVCSEDEIVLIHDGVRPLISERLITNNIEVAKKHGNAITVDYARETVVASASSNEISKVFERDEMRIAKAPQTFQFRDIYKEYCTSMQKQEVYKDSCELMKTNGYELHTVQSTEYNIKITTPSDFYIFRAILDALDNSQIFGLN